MWSRFSQKFQENYSQRKEQVALISSLLDSNSDMVIYGISGTGKTCLIRDLLIEKEINYVKVNCIQCQTKQTLIQSLITQLEKRFKFKLKATTKTSQLIHSLNQLHEYTQNKTYGDQKDMYFSFEDFPFYLLLDNVEKLSITPKFFSQLINIKNILKINFNIIFCGIQFREEVMLENSDLDLLPYIMIPPMNNEDLKRIIKKYIDSKIQESERNCFLKFGDRFINDIIQNFTLIVKSATTLSSIALRLFKILILNYLQKDNPQLKDFVYLIKDDNYCAARRLILSDPYLNDGDSKDFVDKIINNKPSATESFTLINPMQIQKLPFYPAMILIACWVGNRNPESTDKKLFKDYKGKQYKGKQEGGFNTLKAVKIDRLMALAQSLISSNIYLQSYNESQGKDNLHEISTYDQTIDFYSQVASLVEMNYITIDSNEGSLAKTQYVSTMDEQFIQSIAIQYKIRFHDILYRKD